MTITVFDAEEQFIGPIFLLNAQLVYGITHGFFGHEKGGKAICPMPLSKRFLAVRSFLVLGCEQLYALLHCIGKGNIQI